MGQSKQNDPEILPGTIQTHLAMMQPYIQPGTSKSNHFGTKQNNDSEILPETNKTTSLMKPNTWSDNQTLMFLDLCSENKERLTNVKYKKTKVYKDIDIELQNKGHYFTADQCANRLKTLTAKYKQIRDHNSQSGNSHKDWMLFDSMAEYCGDRPGITPRAVCSSIRLADDAVPASSQTRTNETFTAETTENSGKKISTDCTGKVKRICKRVSPRVEMVKWLQEYEKEVSEREERRIALAREQHAENKKFMADMC
ncbi:unnamed protein product [Phaedon cochleariae]|uniref:Myb/SANT-like DNA-binding domain-containing protein n=1 Tax=Phaedon cochleariae TaxID=80249 RepID=A0A9N9SKA4_PHACE|nr:unnamed protein product [Phaedon cochleariae]